MNWFRFPVLAMFEFVYPECCCLCGAVRGGLPWTPRGRPAKELRWWDRSQLCRPCLEMIRGDGPLSREATLNRPAVWAGTVTGPALVKAVGMWKYHGLRGLAWPLAGLMANAIGSWDTVPVLVPIALHGRRRRERGFNQAEVVAGLVATMKDWPLDLGVLKRRRSTAQQARIEDDEARRANMVEAFVVRKPIRNETARPLLLVDDLVTSGATARAAALVLQAAGWQVAGVLALGLAAGEREVAGPVDTGGDGF